MQAVAAALLNTLAGSAQTRTTQPAIKREGDQIILPENMGYDEGRMWLTRAEEAEESKINVHDQIDCFPLDGMIALSRAFKEVYGFTEVDGFRGFWGEEIPPTMVQVEVPNGFETAVFGKLCPPKWEGGFLNPQIKGPRLTIAGELKRKFEPEVKRLIAVTRRMLKEQSIYRGQAVQVDLHWYDDGNFHPINDAPKFMSLNEASLILNPETEFQLGTSVLMLIERTQQCVQNHVPLKHGALFKGPYGCGKTLAAKFIAKKCVENNWTFIYLKNAEQIANGLRIAKLYAPAVVFAEDVDTVTKNRDDDMNELLNTLDGVDTKDAPIITILTTNHVEQIDPSFLRAGRIDSVIDFDVPEAETAAKFVTQYGAELIAKDVDMDVVGHAFKGLVPAFIRECVSKAKTFTMYRTGQSDITGLVTTDDLTRAADQAQRQVKLMNKKAKSKEEELADAVRVVHTAGLNGTLEEVCEDIANRVAEKV